MVRAKAKAVRLAEPQPGQAGPSVACAGERGREGTKAERAWRPRLAVPWCDAARATYQTFSEASLGHLSATATIAASVSLSQPLGVVGGGGRSGWW